MKSFSLLFLSLLSFALLNGQDTYHTNFQDYLQSEYGLPAADWVFFDTENAILSEAIHYGCSASQLNAQDQEFALKTHLVIGAGGGEPWSSGWNIRNQQAVQSGDVLLAAFYIRSLEGAGKVNFFVENASTFAKEVILTLDIDEEWRRYLIPFQSGATYSFESLVWGFHLGFQAQTIEVGGFTALNFNNDVTLDALPEEINNEFYGGWAPDAPWRSAAAERIEELRKTDLNIQVSTTSGAPVAQAAVHVKMLQHEFAFGTAIKASLIAGNNDYNVVYENKLINLDGQGHGFNWVVFENDLKWPAWEDEWFVNKQELVNAVSWLNNHDIQIRGHNLVWPGSDNLPSDVAANLNNTAYIWDRIDGHLENILTYPGIEGHIPEWDVLNEIVTNRSLENAFFGEPNYLTGRELYPEIFERVRQLDANTGLWLNDYVTISNNQSPGSSQYDQLKQFTGEIVNSGVDIEGIGFQGHIGGFPNGIPSVLATYDDFYDSFGLKAKVTEFDMANIVSEELAANYLRDFLTATFSHPSMNGFLFWSFWDGATWLNYGSNFYTQNWTPTPAKDAFVDLVFNEWWTDETRTSNAAGQVNTRVFKGRYEISYECDGEMVSDTLSITEALNYEIACDNITTDVNDTQGQQGFLIYPNPVQNVLHIENRTTAELAIRLINSNGQLIAQTRSFDPLVLIDTTALKGLYLLELISTEGKWVKKVLID